MCPLYSEQSKQKRRFLPFWDMVEHVPNTLTLPRPPPAFKFTFTVPVFPLTFPSPTSNLIIVQHPFYRFIFYNQIAFPLVLSLPTSRPHKYTKLKLNMRPRTAGNSARKGEITSDVAPKRRSTFPLVFKFGPRPQDEMKRKTSSGPEEEDPKRIKTDDEQEEVKLAVESPGKAYATPESTNPTQTGNAITASAIPDSPPEVIVALTETTAQTATPLEQEIVRVEPESLEVPPRPSLDGIETAQVEPNGSEAGFSENITDSTLPNARNPNYDETFCEDPNYTIILGSPQSIRCGVSASILRISSPIFKTLLLTSPNSLTIKYESPPLFIHMLHLAHHTYKHRPKVLTFQELIDLASICENYDRIEFGAAVS
ncbi:hypothetical protein EJ08DRAFT_735694 [Tothia fuscella]|uniref:BTB domain-containing protein n=1 Tax=Tothia fuscella TaxID=1048955 RepID=A0A9P4TVT8_9PEZI|nr:hypothetical protein EJ08DRAFT_735694 [Tothia fuscella]